MRNVPSHRKILVVLVLAVFLVGEYAFVEFYPLSPSARKHKFEKLPIVSSIVEASQLRTIREDFARHGAVTVKYRGEDYRFSDADHLMEAKRSGDTAARMAANRSLYRAHVADRIDETREQAELGSTNAMFAYYQNATLLNRQSDAEHARQLLENSGKDSARWYLDVMLDKRVDPLSREGLLLAAKAYIEYCDEPASSLLRESCQSESLPDHVQRLKTQARAGDADAAWVLDQLDQTRAS